MPVGVPIFRRATVTRPAGENVSPAERPTERTTPTPLEQARYACRYFRGGLDKAAAAHDVPLVMLIEHRNATMTPNNPSPNKLRAKTGLGRAWRLVSSFFSLAARSLPAAGV